MNEITCEICMDLLPLVKDGIASEDSKQAVLQHIKTCDVCRSFYDGNTPPVVNMEKAFHKMQRQIQICSAMLLMFGIFCGLSLTGGSGLFYNSLLMPMIGVLGYFLFLWRAFYMVPFLLLITHSITNFFGLVQGAEYLNPYSLLMWTAIYAFFALLGVVIASLLHYAFRRK